MVVHVTLEFSSFVTKDEANAEKRFAQNEAMQVMQDLH
jgi:hypothetical protein